MCNKDEQDIINSTLALACSTAIWLLHFFLQNTFFKNMNILLTFLKTFFIYSIYTGKTFPLLGLLKFFSFLILYLIENNACTVQSNSKNARFSRKAAESKC